MQTMSDKLRPLLEQAPSDASTILVTEGEVELEIQLEKAGSLAGELRMLRMEFPEDKSVSFADFQERCEALCQKTSYLPEELRIMEEDQAGEMLLIRSGPPASTPAGSEFFELQIRKRGWLQLSRLTADENGNRQDASVPLTKQVICRFADDLQELFSG